LLTPSLFLKAQRGVDCQRRWSRAPKPATALTDNAALSIGEKPSDEHQQTGRELLDD
jgi:hypothetical protein